MQAIRLHAFGPADNLTLEEVPNPKPGAGQVLIDVHAAGVHVLDTVIHAGESGGPFPLPELPTIPGREVAGVVIGVGADVDPAWSGRSVVAHLGIASSGYAERAVGRGRFPARGARPSRCRVCGGDDRHRHRVRSARHDQPGRRRRRADPRTARGLGNLFVQEARHVGSVQCRPRRRGGEGGGGRHARCRRGDRLPTAGLARRGAGGARRAVDHRRPRRRGRAASRPRLRAARPRRSPHRVRLHGRRADGDHRRPCRAA